MPSAGPHTNMNSNNLSTLTVPASMHQHFNATAYPVSNMMPLNDLNRTQLIANPVVSAAAMPLH